MRLWPTFPSNLINEQKYLQQIEIKRSKTSVGKDRSAVIAEHLRIEELCNLTRTKRARERESHPRTHCVRKANKLKFMMQWQQWGDSHNLEYTEVNFSYHELSPVSSPAAASTYNSQNPPVYLSLHLSISSCTPGKIFDFHFVLTHFKEEKLPSRQDKSLLCICSEPMCACVGCAMGKCVLLRHIFLSSGAGLV